MKKVIDKILEVAIAVSICLASYWLTLAIIELIKGGYVI